MSKTAFAGLETLDTIKPSEDGVDMPVKKPDGSPLLQKDGKKPVTIKLRGPDSKIYREKMRELITKRSADMSRDMTPIAQLDAESIDILVACTISWDGFLSADGKQVPCTFETARDLYLAYPTVRDQVDNFIGVRRNFMAAS